MDPMKDAIKKRMMNKGSMDAVKSGEMAPPVDGAADESLEAPALEAPAMEGAEKMGVEPELLSAAESTVGTDELRKILMAIADSSSGSGRAADSLGERAAMGAADKLKGMGPIKG